MPLRTFQGDMRMREEQYAAFFAARRRRLLGGGGYELPLWHERRGPRGWVVPYRFGGTDPEFGPSQLTAAREMEVEAVMRSMEDALGPGVITFEEAAPGVHHLRIGHFTDGCWSYVGRTQLEDDDAQSINLSPGCSTDAILHELLHALGFFHEQSRPDRDNHVTINWSNIDSANWGNFDKADSVLDTRATPYDYDSIMHYKSHDFAIDPDTPSIVAGRPLGNAVMSHMDQVQLRMMYRCEDTRNHYAENCAVHCPCRVGEGTCHRDNQCEDDLYCGPRRVCTTERQPGVEGALWVLALPVLALLAYKAFQGCQTGK